MSTSATSGVGSTAAIEAEYSTRVAKITQDQQKQDGETALKLIEGAAPPVSPDGRGKTMHVVA